MPTPTSTAAAATAADSAPNPAPNPAPTAIPSHTPTTAPNPVPAIICQEPSPVILHVPHAGLYFPDAAVQPAIPDLAAEIELMADIDMDRLAWRVRERSVQPPNLVVNVVSRLYMDPERFDDDTEEMNAAGMGVVYTKTHDGRDLYRAPLPPAEVSRRKSSFHWYAHSVRGLAARALVEFGRCLILDLHSYSTDPLPYELHAAAARPPVCLGFEDFHAPDVAGLEAGFAAIGAKCARNEPFQGSYVPLDYYRWDPRLKSVMVEIRKDQYLGPDGYDADRADRLASVLAAFIAAF